MDQPSPYNAHPSLPFQQEWAFQEKLSNTLLKRVLSLCLKGFLLKWGQNKGKSLGVQEWSLGKV